MRWAGWGSVGAGGLVALFLLSSVASAGVATPGAFAGATYQPSGSRSFGGCANALSSYPTWNPTNGVAHWRGASYASSCSGVRGPATTYSSGSSTGGVTILAPVSLKTGSGGVNVSWTIDVGAKDSAVANGSLACPTTTYLFSDNLGYTWVNGSDVYASCYVESEIYLNGYAYLYDLTNGSFYGSSTYWYGLYNVSGSYTYFANYTITYSNSSYWAYNGSTTYFYSGSYGPHGSLTGTYHPVFFMNGTFNASHSYQIYTDIYGYTSAISQGYSSAHASAVLNLLTHGRHATLQRFMVW